MIFWICSSIITQLPSWGTVGVICLIAKQCESPENWSCTRNPSWNKGKTSRSGVSLLALELRLNLNFKLSHCSHSLIFKQYYQFTIFFTGDLVLRVVQREQSVQGHIQAHSDRDLWLNLYLISIFSQEPHLGNLGMKVLQMIDDTLVLSKCLRSLKDAQTLLALQWWTLFLTGEFTIFAYAQNTVRSDWDIVCWTFCYTEWTSLCFAINLISSICIHWLRLLANHMLQKIKVKLKIKILSNQNAITSK